MRIYIKYINNNENRIDWRTRERQEHIRKKTNLIRNVNSDEAKTADELRGRVTSLYQFNIISISEIIVATSCPEWVWSAIESHPHTQLNIARQNSAMWTNESRLKIKWTVLFRNSIELWLVNSSETAHFEIKFSEFCLVNSNLSTATLIQMSNDEFPFEYLPISCCVPLKRNVHCKYMTNCSSTGSSESYEHTKSPLSKCMTPHTKNLIWKVHYIRIDMTCEVSSMTYDRSQCLRETSHAHAPNANNATRHLVTENSNFSNCCDLLHELNALFIFDCHGRTFALSHTRTLAYSHAL